MQHLLFDTPSSFICIHHHLKCSQFGVFILRLFIINIKKPPQRFTSVWSFEFSVGPVMRRLLKSDLAELSPQEACELYFDLI